MSIQVYYPTGEALLHFITLYSMEIGNLVLASWLSSQSGKYMKKFICKETNLEDQKSESTH